MTVCFFSQHPRRDAICNGRRDVTFKRTSHTKHGRYISKMPHQTFLPNQNTSNEGIMNVKSIIAVQLGVQGQLLSGWGWAHYGRVCLSAWHTHIYPHMQTYAHRQTAVVWCGGSVLTGALALTVTSLITGGVCQFL